MQNPVKFISKGARGRGTLEKEKLPIFGMIQRGGEDTKRFATARVNMLVTKTATAFLPTRWKGHVNTMEGVWSLLRSWLRPHRGISQEKLPVHIAFFEFVHNARKHGAALFESLIRTLLKQSTRNQV